MASVGKEVILKSTPSELVQRESSDRVVTVPKKDTLDEDSFTEVSDLCSYFESSNLSSPCLLKPAGV